MDALIGYSIGTVIGIAFFASGVFLLRHAKSEQARCSVKAAGRVVEYASRKKTVRMNDSSRIDTFYYPIIEYQVHCQPVRGQSLDGSTRKKYEIGTDVNLHYNPDKPTEMILPARKTLIPFAWLYIVSGIMVTVLTYIFVPVLIS